MAANAMATPRIVGGTELAYPRELQFLVSLQEAGFHFCGGSLIAPTWVLTAAHCTIGGGLDDVKVGMHDRRYASSDDCVQTQRAKQIINHAQYNPNTLEHDIALIELSTPVEYAAIPVHTGPRGEGLEAADTDVIAAGWGALAWGGGPPDAPQKVTLPIVADATCNQNYGGGITSGMICAGLPEGGKDSCQGDSGGPLFYNQPGEPQKLVGVVSWGDGCAFPNKPGVYTRVSRYISWLCRQTSLPLFCDA